MFTWLLIAYVCSASVLPNGLVECRYATAGVYESAKACNEEIERRLAVRDRARSITEFRLMCALVRNR